MWEVWGFGFRVQGLAALLGILGHGGTPRLRSSLSRRTTLGQACGISTGDQLAIHEGEVRTGHLLLGLGLRV